MSLEALFTGSVVAKILDIYLKNQKEEPQHSLDEIAELGNIHYVTTSKAVKMLEKMQILVISGSNGKKRYYRLNYENSMVVQLINFYEGINTTLNKNQEYEIAKDESQEPEIAKAESQEPIEKMPSKTLQELREHLTPLMKNRNGGWYNPFSELVFL